MCIVENKFGYIKMIFKFTVITPKSRVLIKPTITKAEDNETLYNVITSKNYNIENIIEVLTGDSFTCLTSVDIDVLNEITLSDLKSQGKTIHLKVILNEDEEVQGDETQVPPAKRLRTLMDIARVESSWPSYKNTDQVTYLSKYMEHFAKEPAQAIADLDSYAKNSNLQTKVLLFGAILILFKQHCCGVFQENVVNFSNLCQAVRDLLWYVSPHADKFKIRGASLPIFFASLQSFNNPRRHGHALSRLNRETLLSYVDEVTNILEKSFVHPNSFSGIYTPIDKLVESCAKYADYLEENLRNDLEYQSEEPSEKTSITKLPACHAVPFDKVYTSKREREIIDVVRNELDEVNHYEPINIDKYLKGHRSNRYTFLQHLKTLGFVIENVVLYLRSYHLGNMHFLWKEGPFENDNLSIRQNVISSLQKDLPKYFSRAHKAKSRHLLSLIMNEKIKASEFRAIYAELTGDSSETDNTRLKQVDECMQLIMKTADPSILRDLRVNNSRSAKYDIFWSITEKKIEELQAFVVDDRRHGGNIDSEVITNMALAISARDLYEQCATAAKHDGLTDEDVPSLSWFRFQFWPKNPYTHASLNYTGRLKVRYMVQQRAILKQSDDDHYCAAIYKYAREMAVH